MSFKIELTFAETLPKLGWIAVLDKASQSVSAIHGEYVECGKEWMVEGVWDGEFTKGNFHETGAFFGSGMRIVKNKIYFVSSTALTDRILFCERDQQMIVSNSLLLLLGYTGAGLDEEHDYENEANSIIREGVKTYDRTFRVVHPSIKNFNQVFFENMVIENGQVGYEFKASTEEEITTYEDYVKLLLKTLEGLRDNYQSHARKISIRAYTTISSGYDSTAVSALVKKIGVKECFSGSRLDGLFLSAKKETGSEIAKKLGYKIHSLETKRKSITKDELYFLSTNYPKFSNSVWSEISLHAMVKTIESRNEAAVVFTGYRGIIWDKSNKEYHQGNLKGYGALSGLNLSEIRLRAGFYNIAVPYLHATRSQDIFKISNSEEMHNWTLGTSYDRPIARRIVEEAGVDRHFFGMEKRHITTTYLWPINKENRKRYFKYLKKEKGISRIYVIAIYLQKKIICDLLKKKKLFGRDIDFYDMMRKWATELLRREYREKLNQHIEQRLQ